MSFSTTGTVGIDLSRTSTTPEWNLGQIETMNDGVYQYIQADAAIDQYAILRIEEDFGASEGTTTNLPATEPSACGIAVSDIASGSYGWAFIGPGVFTVLVAATCAADVKLYTTATAGQVDDDASGTRLFQGLTLTAATTGAGSSACRAAQRIVVEAEQ